MINKKILIGSILAVSLLTLVSFSSVVGYNSVKSDDDTSVEENATPIELKVQRIKELSQNLDFRKIIVNPYAVLETLEEISFILEDEDLSNYDLLTTFFSDQEGNNICEILNDINRNLTKLVNKLPDK